MTDELIYTANGNGYTVWRDGAQIGKVRRHGLYWHAYTMTDVYVRGTFMSMTAAGRRAAEHNQGDETT
jgi:hypothetical protein